MPRGATVNTSTQPNRYGIGPCLFPGLAILSLSLLGLPSLGCSDAGQSGRSGERCQGDITIAVDAIPERLSQDYEYSCAACHGADGQGRSDYPALHDVTSFQDYVEAVREGSDEGMPAFDHNMIDDETLARDFAYFQGTTETTLDCDLIGDASGFGPDGVAGGSDDEIYARGMEAWRRSHAEGACVNCHAVDAMDLAFFDYDDASIIRRGVGQGASVDDAWAIVDLVHLQRQRHAIEPVNPRRYNFLQPCGEVLDGDTPEERERAFYAALEERGHPYTGERIDSAAAAEEAMKELVSWDLRQVCLGFELAPWTDDSFHGAEFQSINDWIPDFPTMPRPEDAPQWYALHDAYIDDPSPENLWAILDAMEDLTIDEERRTSEGRNWTLDGALGTAKYRAVQTAAHMMRNHTANRPDPGWDAGQGLRGGTTDETVQKFLETTHARTTSMWDVAAGMGSGSMPHPGANSGEWPDFLADKVFLFPEDFRDRIRAPFSRIWFYIGWMYDPALIFTAGANRHEYFLQHLRRGEAYYLHSAFIRAMTFAHVHYGRDTRFSIYNRLGPPLPNGQVVAEFGRGMNGMRGPGFFRHPYFRHGDEDFPEDLAEKFRYFVVNDLRARVFALEASLQRGHVTDDVEDRLDRFDSYASSLEEYEAPDHWPDLQQDLQRIRALLQQASGDVEEATGVENTSMVFRGSHPTDLLELTIPDEAYERTASPFGTTYDQYCAGCHGLYGQGHAGGGETAGKGLEFGGYPRLREYPSWGGFQAYVRHGIDSDVVAMPAFSKDRISDDELRALWEALNDPQNLQEVDP